tara:strand:+ start:918 stop:1370 length:453 start_codon:yes stop_codon:yes gene_type:complete
MNIQKVKQGARITLWNGIYMILFGIFQIFFAEYNMENNFKAVQSIWLLFVRYNLKISKLFLLFNISIGILLVSIGVFITYVSYFIIKRKDKLAWVMLFTSGIISWVGLLIISFLFKNLVLIILSLVGWVMFVLGMFIPIRYYLEKSYREY